MVRNVLNRALVAGVILVLAGCSQPVATQPNFSSLKMASGYEATAEELAKIESATPEALAVISRTLGSRSAAEASAEENLAIVEGHKTILKRLFGADWKKFFVVRSVASTVDLESGKEVSTEPVVFLDPETLTPLPGQDTKELLNASGRSAVNYATGNGYYCRCEGHQSGYPWGVNNAASTTYRVNSSNWTEVPADQVFVSISDKMGKLSYTEYDSSSVAVSGNFDYGVFKSFFSFTAVHRIIDDKVENADDTATFTKHYF